VGVNCLSRLGGAVVGFLVFYIMESHKNTGNEGWLKVQQTRGGGN